MKKLVTLSAIALAGATLGVGTTFGWWSDDTEDPPTTKPETLEVAPTDFQPTFVEVFVSDKTEKPKPDKVELEVIGVKTKSPDGKPDPIVGHIRLVQSGGAAPAFEKLADQLEQEAKELEGHGQREAAAIQRKLAERLRATLQASQAHLKNRKLPTEGKLEKGPPEKLDEIAKRKLGVRHLELKQKGDAELDELTARIKKLESAPQPAPEVKEELQKLRDVLHHRANLMARERGEDQRRHAEHLDRTLAELRETAERLELAGRKDEAHAIREKAEHIRRNFGHEVGEDHKPRFEKHDIVLDDEPRKIIRFRKEIHDGEGKAEVAIIHVDPKDAVKGAGKEKGPATDHEATARITVERLAHVDGAPLFEIQRTLKELRTEIQQLREEVHGLRGLLGAEPRSVKKKVRDDDDVKEKADPKERKVEVRQKESDEADDVKRVPEKKHSDVKRDDDEEENDGEKSDKRKVKGDGDQKSEDREDKDDDESAQAEKSFWFDIGFAR